MNRIWEYLPRRKPPKPDKLAGKLPVYVPAEMAIMIQSSVGRRYVLCEEWRQQHLPNHPKNPHPWEILGVVRDSAYTSGVSILAAPIGNDGVARVRDAVKIPAIKLGVAARQEEK